MVGTHTQAIAQKGSPPASDKIQVNELPAEAVGDHANELLKRINRIVADGDRYSAAMKKASKEDRLVLELQLKALQNRAADTILQLADALLVLEKTTPQPDLRRQVEDLLAYVGPRYWFHINRLRGEVDAVRARRLEAAADERFAIESGVARFTVRLDELFDISLRHIEKMAEIGMDTQRDRGELNRLLSERAEELSGRISLALVRTEALEARLKKIPDDAEASTLLIASLKSLNTNTASMGTTLDLMDQLELDTDAYRSQLVTTTRDFSSSLLNTGVAVGLVSRTIDGITGWMVDSGPTVLLKLLIFFGILFAFRFVTRIVRVGLEKALDASDLNLSQLARRMIVTWTSNLVMIFGVMLALSQLGISLGPLLAGLGVAGFIVGFALQDTLGNFASGVMILIYRPYDTGDLIDVGGVFGKVDKMNLVSTSMLTLDNQTIVVPNSKIWGDVIKNVTAQKVRRVDMVFGISYSDDIPKAEAIFEDILKTHDKVLDDPEPMVRLHTLGSSSVDFVVRPWSKAEDYWDVYWDVTRSVKLRFDEEGVSIPFPQRDVHVYNENSLAPTTK
ncbi:MAG: mechanosensitive ion channel [Desulfosarcina sp.]|nr:mechanosensitive ion channel [Desulfosarcina sp.]MBC2765893.1 mechanosensitive ion channel family protein [Desulfosarcina sp.]